MSWQHSKKEQQKIMAEATRTLRFGSGDEEKKRFVLLVNLVQSGGNLLHYNPQTGPTTWSKEERKKMADFVRAYKAISIENPSGSRELAPAGGTITLRIPSYEQMLKFADAAPGGAADSDVIDDLLDWIHGMPIDPKPEEKGT